MATPLSIFSGCTVEPDTTTTLYLTKQPWPAVIAIVSHTDSDLNAAFFQASDTVDKYPDLIGASSTIDYPANSVHMSIPSAEAQLKIRNDPQTQSESPQPRTIEQIRLAIQHLLQDFEKINQDFTNGHGEQPILSITNDGIPAIPSNASNSTSS